MLTGGDTRPLEPDLDERRLLALAGLTNVMFREGAPPELPADRVVVHPGPRSGPNDDTAVTVVRIRDSNAHWFCYADGCRFEISATGDAVAAYGPSEMSRADLLVYLLGPVMGFVLRLRGVVSLHASAVVLGPGAVAFVGAGGAGKSTLAARLALGGRTVVTEDVLPVEEGTAGFCVRPTVPQIKLWPEAVQQLLGRGDALPKLVPQSRDWDKRCLDLTRPGLAFASGRPPLRAVYLLEPRSAAITAPRLAPVAPAEALLALIAHSYVNYALSKEMREHEFNVLSRLVQVVPVGRLTLPEGATEVDALCGCLEADLARGAAPSR